MPDAATWFTAITATVSAAAAVASWRAARNSSKAAKRLEAIESARRHEELTPEIDANLGRFPSGAPALSLTLVGPTAVLALDSFAIAIRGDGLDPKATTPEAYWGKIGEHAWGPAQFHKGLKDVRSTTESDTLLAIEQGTEVRIPIELSTAPRWVEGETWNARYLKQPMRIAITCTRDGEDWVVHKNVDVARLFL